MEARGFSRPPYCITADPLLVNLKEETPGVILSNLDLVTPVYSLVPTVKLEPVPENTLEWVVDSKIKNTYNNGHGSCFSDTELIKTEKGCIETILRQGTVSRELACPTATHNLVPYLNENAGVLNEKCLSLPKIEASEIEHSDLKLSTFKNLAVGREPCNDNAFIKVLEYSRLTVTEVDSETVESFSNKKLSTATHTRREPSLKYNPYVKLVDIFANSLGASSPRTTIVKNCDVSVSPFAPEMIVGNCELPLLPDENSLNPSNPERFEWSRKRKATNESINSESVISQFTDSVKKKCIAKQLKKVVKKQPDIKSKARFKGNEQTSKVLRDGANILNLPASKKYVTRRNSQPKDIGLPLKSPSKNSNIPSSLNASPGDSIPSTCMDTVENSLKNVEETPKIILSKLRQAVERNLRKSSEKTGPENISVDDNFISDSPLQIEESSEAPDVPTDDDSSSLNDETLSGSNDVYDESNLIADAPVEAPECNKGLKDVAPEKNSLPNLNEEETLSPLNDVPKSTLVNTEQSEERIASLGTVVFDEAAKMAVTNSSVPPISSGDVSSVNFKKIASILKQQLKKVESSKVAAATENSANNCTVSSSSSENTTLSLGGNPKPILLSIEQWKKTAEPLISCRQRCDERWRKHTIFANEQLTIKTVKMFSSEGKPFKEKLYFIEGKGWACERCEKIFQKSCHLLDHRKWCLVDLITCSRCPRTYKTLGHFKAHLLFCQKPVYKCPECPRVHHYEYQYDRHYSVHHGKDYICAECTPPRRFKNEVILKRHVKIVHKGLPRVTCNACGLVLRRKSFKKHMRSHDVKKIVCIHCGSHFTAERSLQIHWKTHNDTGNPAALMCAYCGKFFELKTELVKHLKEHENERSFICEHCGKGFFRVHHLDTHLLSHKEKQFICPKCNRGFTLKHQLAAHLQTIACGGDNALTSSKKKKVEGTDKKKPSSVSKQKFTCAHCDKGFPSKRQLIIHLRTVLCGQNASSTLKDAQKVGRKKETLANLSPSPKNQFTCASCNKTFIRKGLLVAHLSAELCSEGTLTIPNEKVNSFEASKKENHGLRVKSENQYVCANCGISFSYKHLLIAHLNVGPCCNVMSLGRNIIETKSEDEKKLVLTSEKHFITVFEHFVHKRQLVNDVTCGKDLASSVEKPMIKNKILKKKTEKSKLVQNNQFRCEKCGQRFIYKRQLTAHLSAVFCGNGAVTSVETTKTAIKTIKNRQKLRSPPTNQLTCGKCGQSFARKRQLAAHLSSADCCGNVISSRKKLRNVVGMKQEEKTLKSAPGVLFLCANCNQGFVHKRKLATHLGAGSCMSSARTVSEKTKEADRPEKEEEEQSLLTKNQLHSENFDQTFVLKSGTRHCSSRNNVLSSSKQTVEAATKNVNKEKELIPISPEKLFVCGSCDNGFSNKQRLNDHICSAACCSLSLSSSVEAKKTAEVQKTKKIESMSAPKRRSVRMRNVVHERLVPRSCRSITRSSVKEQTKEVGAKKDEKKISRSLSAEKQFFCRKCDQHFTLKRQLTSHACTRALHVLKKSKIAKAVKTVKSAVGKRGKYCDRLENNKRGIRS